MTYDQYREARYFPALDGTRAVSILLVVLFHVGSATFVWANGRLGVTVFFVLSGFLITTLLLRERDRTGTVSLIGFYKRRAFRILPLYYFVLFIYIGLYIGAGFGNRAFDLRHSLGWFLTYMNDFRPGILHGSTPYQQSWSLGVEEKFYVFWPLLAFVLIPRVRIWIAATAAAIPTVLYVASVGSWFAYYGQIMVGCLLAIAMHHRQGYATLTRVARGPAALALAVVLLVLERHHPVFGLLFPFVVAVVLAGLVTGGTGAWLLSRKPMIWMGERAYAVYLVHLLCLLFVLHAVRHVVGAGLPQDTMVFVIGGALAFLCADILRRTIELPIIALGRSLRREPKPAVSATTPA